MPKENDFDVTVGDDDTDLMVRLTQDSAEESGYKLVTISDADGAPIDVDEETRDEAFDAACKKAETEGWDDSGPEESGEEDEAEADGEGEVA